MRIAPDKLSLDEWLNGCITQIAQLSLMAGVSPEDNRAAKVLCGKLEANLMRRGLSTRKLGPEVVHIQRHGLHLIGGADLERGRA